MNWLFRLAPPGALVALVLLNFSGCSRTAALDPAVVESHRTRLVLSEEPDDVLTVVEVRSALLGIEPADSHADHDHGEDGDESDMVEHDPEEHAHDDHDHDHDHDHGDHDHGHSHGDSAATAGPSQKRTVALVGVVGGVPNPSAQSYPEFPFAKNEAMFFLIDPEATADNDEEGHHHHAPGEECAFCLANAAEASQLIAAVQFLDAQGKVLPVDARTLFQLKEGDVVVVRGEAQVAPGGVLTVHATGLYVRQ